MPEDKGKISDGYHTFDELYEHRITLWIAVCRLYSELHHRCEDKVVWRSKLHSDGSSYPSWFILGIGHSSGKQITYHIPLYKWDECDFAPDLDRAPDFDGHSASDVLERIAELN
jgi:hypothetical protein